VLLALLALNVIQTVLLQLKTIPCDSAYAWHTPGLTDGCVTMLSNSRGCKLSVFALIL